MIEFGSTKELSNMIQAFSVKNYRGLRDFTIEPLDRVNLITGSNNVGKTALLEALYLNLATGTALNSNLEQGKRPSSTWINLFRGFKDVPFNLDNVSKWGWLFPGKDLTKDIELISKDEFDIHHVVDMYWRVENKSEGAAIPPGISLDDLSLFMDVKFQNNRRNTFIWKVQKNGHQPPQSPLVFDSIPLRLLFNSSSRDPGEDTKWFSTLADVGRQDEVVNTLKVIEPRLKNLAISTSDGPAMIYCDIGIGRRIPMSQMGEGMTRLLSLVLEITNASGGVVLIDEIENGLHHSVLTKVWTAIGDAARRSDTQIFATTHSWECIKSAHEAFLNSEIYDLRLHRIDRIGQDITAITYDQKTLDTSVEMSLEVR